MKNIVLSEEMARQLFEGKKRYARCPIEPQPQGAHTILGYNEDDNTMDFMCGSIEPGYCIDWIQSIEVPCKEGEIFHIEGTDAYLSIEGIFAELIQQASEEDAREAGFESDIQVPGGKCALQRLAEDWNRQFGDEFSWSTNPWVWLMEIKLCEKPAEE